MAFYASLAYFNNINDFPEYFSTGSLLKAGKALRIYDLASQFQQQQLDFPGFRQPGVGFFLAPTALPFAFLISLLSPNLAKTIWSISLLLSAPAICILLKTWLRLQWSSLLWLVAVVCSNGPLFESIRIGQPGPFLLLCCLAGTMLLSGRHEYKGAWLLSLLSVKPQFALIFACFLAGRKQWQALAMSGLAVLLWAAPVLLATGNQAIYDYLHLLNSETALPFMQPQLSPTARGVILAVLPGGNEPLWCKLVTSGLFAAGLAIAFFTGGKLEKQAAPCFALALILPVMCALAPHCHLYDLVFLIPSLVYLLVQAWGTGNSALRTLSLLLVLLFSQPATQVIYYGLVQPALLPNMYFLAVLLLFFALWKTGCLTTKNPLS